MIVDQLNTLSTNMAGRGAGSYISDDNIDLLAVSTAAGNASRLRNDRIDLAEGQQLYAVWTITTAFTGAGTNFTFRIITASAAVAGGGTSPADLVVHATTLALTPAELPAGRQFVTAINPIMTQNGILSATTGFNRYMYAQVVLAGASAATGIMVCNIVPNIADGRSFYTSGFVVNTSGV